MLVKSPTGELGEVPDEQAEQAVAAGYTPATPQDIAAEERRKSLDSPLLAGLAGAGRGLTFGLSDAALVKTGAVKADTLKGLQEENPTASTLGELAGAVLPVALTDGAGAAGEAGLVARAKGLLSAPSRALGAASEGAAAAVDGLGLGRAAATVARGAVEGAAYKAGDNLSEAIIEDKPLTAQALFHDVGLGALFGGATVGVLDKALGAVAEHVPPALKKAEGALNRLGDRAAVGGEVLEKELPAALHAVDEAVAHAEGQVPARWEQLLQHEEARPEVAQALVERATALPQGPAQESLLRAAEEAAAAPSLHAQHQVAMQLARETAPEVRLLGTELASSPLFGEAGAHAAELRRVLPPLQEARAALEAAAPAEKASAALAWKERATTALQTLQEGTLRHTGGPVTSVERALEAAGRIGGEVADHPSPLAHALEAIGHSPMLGALGLGHSMGLPLHALAGIAPVAAVGMGLATVARGGQSATVARLARRGAEAASLIRSSVEAAVSTRPSARAAASAVASSAAPRKPFERSATATMRRIADIRALAADPSALASRMAEAGPLLQQHAPQVAAALVGAATRSAQYLASVAPKDPRPPTPMPQRPYQPSDTERRQYEWVERAVAQPMTLLADLRDGTVRPAAVSAVAQVHPDIYARMCAELRDTLTRRKEPLPSGLQVQIDLFLGGAVSPSGKAAQTMATLPPPVPEQPPAGAPMKGQHGQRARLQTDGLQDV